MRRGRIVACVCLVAIFLAALVTSLDYSLIDALGPGPDGQPIESSHLAPRDTAFAPVQHCGQPGEAPATAL